MSALDTDVLVRHLVRDDRKQFEASVRLVGACLAQGKPLFVPVTVALELEWALRSKFGLTKVDVIRSISSLLSAIELHFESERALEQALGRCRDGQADFSDGLHAALAARAGRAPLWTFDRAAAGLEGAALLA